MDGQSVKTTERGGVRGFDGHKRVKGRKRYILVDTLGLPIASRVEPANISDRRAAFLLLGGLGPLFPDIRTVIADAAGKGTGVFGDYKSQGCEEWQVTP
jgi:putative transposase